MTLLPNKFSNLSIETEIVLISTREAAKLVGYTTDYVARLAREDKISAERRGSQWLIDRDSLKLFALEAEAEKRNRKKNLRSQRLRERATTLIQEQTESVEKEITVYSKLAVLQTAVLSLCFLVAANLMWFAVESNLNTRQLSDGIEAIGGSFKEVIFTPSAEFLSQAASLAFVGKPLSLDTQSDFSIKPATVGSSSQENFEGVVVIEMDNSYASSSELEQSFSDEVRVEFIDDGTGAVTPIFKSGTGETYRLKMVDDSSEIEMN